jgi:hypothetical protein
VQAGGEEPGGALDAERKAGDTILQTKWCAGAEAKRTESATGSKGRNETGGSNQVSSRVEKIKHQCHA